MSTTFKLNLNDRQITQAVIDAFTEANDKFEEEAQREITDPKWPWPQPGSDIVDLGQLKGSYERDTRDGGKEVSHSWTARHAMANHEGAKFRNGRVHQARPWTGEPISQFEDNFEALAQVKLSRVK